MNINIPAAARRLVASRFFLACIVLLSVLLTGRASLTPGGGVGFERRPHFTGERADACLPCHSGEDIESGADGPHGKLSNPAAPYSKEACESCHGAGSFHVSRAHGGRGFPGLLRFGRGSGFSSRREQVQACLACHENDKSGAPLIGFTKSDHDINPIICSDCHTVHTAPRQMSDPSAQTGACTRCHGQQKVGHPKRNVNPPGLNRQKCSTCHDVHPREGRNVGTIESVVARARLRKG